MQGYALSADGFLSREFPSPELLAEDVRVRVEYACLEAESALDDVCPGGGLVGVVVECGAAATAFQDARVLVPQVIACGECDTCRRGAATVCPSRRVLGRDQHGGCAETVVCSGRWLTRVDELITLEGPMAALAAGPALRAYALFCKAGVAAGEVVIVLGTGATAEILALLVTSRGAKLARGMSETSAEAIENQLSEQGCTNRPQKLFVVEGECNLELAVQIAHPSSVITTAIGVGNVDLQKLFDRGLSLLSLSYGHPDLLPETAALIAKGELDLGAILSEAVLGPESFEQSRKAQSDGKCLVVHRA